MVGELEREVIIRELAKDGWNRTRTAKRLEVSLRAFMDKLKRYEIREE
jgi:DNA-binding NtrC family response regulator